MLLGYNTNGWAHHDPLAAMELLAEIGYRSVAITLDHHWLNPYRPRPAAADRSCSRRVGSAETGQRGGNRSPVPARPARQARADFGLGPTRRIALGGSTFSAAPSTSPPNCRAIAFRSGRESCRDEAPADVAWQRLTDGLKPVLEHAAERGVMLGFEPEPGMLIDTLERFAELGTRLPDERLQLTLDVGHLHCLGEVPIAAAIGRVAGRIVNVHIEDMRAGSSRALDVRRRGDRFSAGDRRLATVRLSGRFACRTQPPQPRCGRRGGAIVQFFSAARRHARIVMAGRL